MIYKFRSKAAGDVIMMGPTGDRVLAAIGREAAPKGILEPAAMASAMAALEAAIAADDEARRRAAQDDDGGEQAPVAADGGDAMSLRRRAWPLIEMMKRAQAAGEPIVWGV